MGEPDEHHRHYTGSSVVTPIPINTLRQATEPIQSVYVAIGNSDDKLPQRRWACFQIDTEQAIHDSGATVHGVWHSAPESIYQNACYCFEIEEAKTPELKGTLAGIAKEYQQDAIAWSVTTSAEFLGTKPASLHHAGSDRWTGGDRKDER